VCEHTYLRAMIFAAFLVFVNTPNEINSGKRALSLGLVNLCSTNIRTNGPSMLYPRRDAFHMTITSARDHWVRCISTLVEYLHTWRRCSGYHLRLSLPTSRHTQAIKCQYSDKLGKNPKLLDLMNETKTRHYAGARQDLELGRPAAREGMGVC
jgi:hypothetical protein